MQRQIEREEERKRENAPCNINELDVAPEGGRWEGNGLKISFVDLFCFPFYEKKEKNSFFSLRYTTLL